jgi:hypothetical protein
MAYGFMPNAVVVSSTPCTIAQCLPLYQTTLRQRVLIGACLIASSFGGVAPMVRVITSHPAVSGRALETTSPALWSTRSGRFPARLSATLCLHASLASRCRCLKIATANGGVGCQIRSSDPWHGVRLAASAAVYHGSGRTNRGSTNAPPCQDASAANTPLVTMLPLAYGALPGFDWE